MEYAQASSDGKYLYVDVTTINEVVIIDTNNLGIVKRIPTGNVPFWIAVPGNDGLLLLFYLKTVERSKCANMPES